jgi:hypothetical protein
MGFAEVDRWQVASQQMNDRTWLTMDAVKQCSSATLAQTRFFCALSISASGGAKPASSCCLHDHTNKNHGAWAKHRINGVEDGQARNTVLQFVKSTCDAFVQPIEVSHCRMESNMQTLMGEEEQVCHQIGRP